MSLDLTASSNISGLFYLPFYRDVTTMEAAGADVIAVRARIVISLVVHSKGQVLTMKMWHIYTNPNEYRSLDTPEIPAGDYGALENLFRSGKSLAAAWKPLKVELFQDEEEDSKPVGDFPTLAGIVPLIMSEKARAKLATLIQGNGEFLPLDSNFGIYYAANAYIVDCLEREKSQIVKFSDGGIMRVERYAFDMDKLKGKHIFRIPEEALSRTFIDEDFKTVVETSGLRGLTFREVSLV